MTTQADPSGFGTFVPGFDFLQKLAQGGPATFQQWIAPTLDPKALDQRIDELKAVQFWLEQNAAALKATLQALEVQKMTLATLQSMGAMSGAAAQSSAKAKSTPNPAGAGPDPMQYWTALTQQFQQIATDALSDVARRAATAPAAAKAKPQPAAAAGTPPPAAKKPRRPKGGPAA